jgi:hypothetical protein
MASRGYATANNGLQRGFLAVRHNPGVDAAVTLEDAEDNGLATGSTTALASHSTSAEAGLVNLDFARRRRARLVHTLVRCGL